MTSRGLLHIALLALPAVLSPTVAVANEPAGGQGRHLRVLAVGNSFSRNATSYVVGIAEADGNRLTLGQASIGGCTLQRHWNHAAQFEADPADPDGRPYGGKSLRQLLTDEPWDFVTIQQRSMDSFKPETYRPYARLLHDYIKKHAPQAEVLVHQTWAYRADDPLFESPEFQVHDMHRELTAAYEAISRELGCRFLPVGAAFENARLSDRWPDRFPAPGFNPAEAEPPNLPDQRYSLHVGYRWLKRNGGRLQLSYDGHHANTAGCYLGSAVWYEALFGRSVVGNRFIPGGLDAPRVALLQQIAHQTVTEKGLVPAGGVFAPQQDRLPVPPPKGAVVLFDGKDTNRMLGKGGGPINWPVEDGVLVSTPADTRSNHIVSKLHFRDADIHVEFMLPEKGPGNSGVYIHGNYELQIINSCAKDETELTHEDAGGIYGFHKPLAQACRKPGEWQVYDIRYRAPRRDENGAIVEEGSITAYLNGVKVQDNARFGEPRSVYHPYRYKTTAYLTAIWERQKRTGVGPLFLQDHDAPVRFRNVWVRPLDDDAYLYEADATAN